MIRRHRFVTTSEGWKQLKWWSREASLYLSGSIGDALDAEMAYFDSGQGDGAEAYAKAKAALGARICEQISGMLREQEVRSDGEHRPDGAMSFHRAPGAAMGARGGKKGGTHVGGGADDVLDCVIVRSREELEAASQVLGTSRPLRSAFANCLSERSSLASP